MFNLRHVLRHEKNYIKPKPSLFLNKFHVVILLHRDMINQASTLRMMFENSLKIAESLGECNLKEYSKHE